MSDSDHAQLRWIGHACFALTSPAGTSVLIDPLPTDMGYPVDDMPAFDLVLVSHAHFDHNNVALASGDPTVIHGSTPDAWHPQQFDQGDVHVRVIAGAYHDESQGAERGRTAIFSIETAGIRLLHLGDLGHRLDTNLLAECAGHDVVCVPIGGYFTIDAEVARDVVEMLRASIVIPMHYKTDRLGGDFPIADLAGSGFLDRQTVDRRGESSMPLSASRLPATPTTVVLATP